MSGTFGTMNGKPCWSPSARTKCYEFEGTREDESISLADIPAIIRQGIRDGLITMPDPQPKNAPPRIGNCSEWVKCSGCSEMFGRAKNSEQTKCKICRLDKKSCKACQKTFQPLQRKQVVCSIACRNVISKAAAMKRANKIVETKCAGCGNIFTQKDSIHRYRLNCSPACGLISMKRTRQQQSKNK